MGVEAYAQGHYTLGSLEAAAFPGMVTDPDQWKKAMDHYETAPVSSVMGFTPNLTPVEGECLAIRQVIEEYRKELYTGTSDPDKILPEMLSA